MQVKTHISCAQRCNDGERCKKESPQSLLDKFLDGGLEIPKEIFDNWIAGEKHRPFILLIAGAPGTGKTTFALELAYRWAEKGHGEGKDGVLLNTFYFTSESSAEMLLDGKITKFGWNAKIFNIPEAPNLAIIKNKGWVALYGTGVDEDLDTSDLETFFTELHKKWELWIEQNPRGMLREGPPNAPAMVVVDNLNIFESISKKKEAFKKLLYEFKGSPLILTVILDSLNESKRQSWEYIADMVLKVERTDLLASSNNQTTYNIGTFEIAKARWQKHVFGIHQTNISSEEGGVQIYPSLHYSQSKAGQDNKKSEDDKKDKPRCISTSVKGLDDLLCGNSADRRWAGFPTGGCTAMVGVRGTKKSHLAYNWLLKNAVERKEDVAGNNKDYPGQGLLISLQDAGSAALSRLAEIAGYEGFFQNKDEKSIRTKETKKYEALIKKLKNEIKDNIPIVYFNPSYITPAKFLYTLRTYLDKHKPNHVVINAFEQLDTLFPLCAAQPIFVSSIIGILRGRGITSVATGVLPSDLSGRDIGHGLLPNSDLVLRFESKSIPTISLTEGCRKEICEKKYNIKVDELPERINETIVDVNRVPSAKACGGKGILYLDNKDNKLDFIQLF